MVGILLLFEVLIYAVPVLPLTMTIGFARLFAPPAFPPVVMAAVLLPVASPTKMVPSLRNLLGATFVWLSIFPFKMRVSPRNVLGIALMPAVSLPNDPAPVLIKAMMP